MKSEFQLMYSFCGQLLQLLLTLYLILLFYMANLCVNHYELGKFYCFNQNLIIQINIMKYCQLQYYS